MYRISKKFMFEAAHQLTHLSDGHKCANLHGHSYCAEFIFESEALDEQGFVIDFGRLGAIKLFVDEVLDHKFLNDAVGNGDPKATTSENLAGFLFVRFRAMFRQLVAVRVSETKNTYAEFSLGSDIAPAS